MATNIVSALKAEISELQDELRNDPRHRKLVRLRAALAEYESPNTVLQPEPIKSLESSGTPTVTFETKGDKIKAEITALLQQRGTVHRKEILNHLIAFGLMGHEKDPMASLAAYFSGWRDIFEPDGAGNWSLKQELRAAE